MNETHKQININTQRAWLIYATIIIITVLNCRIVCAQTPDSLRLKNLAQKHNLLIGAATDLNHNDINEEHIIINEYSILSNENCMKPNKLQPTKNVFDFKQSDYFMNFCKKNNLIAKGHKLIARDAYMPDWMLDSTLTPGELKQILVHHIENVMGRYKTGSEYGEIKYWEVLNEVISDASIYASIFEKIGKNSDGDYLYWELAFRTAHSVDPNCVLIWNEDNIEFDVPKAEKLYETIKRLKEKGVPIDGVGFQCHIGLVGQPVPDFIKLAEMFQKFADLGLYIAITELDVGENLEQIEIYKKMMQLCLNQPNCISWSTWNVVDKYSWRRIFLHEAQAPLLFDDNYQPKPAYHAVQKILMNSNPSSYERVLPHKTVND